MDGDIRHFCIVADCDETTARHYLDACNGNLQMALMMFLDATGSSSGGPVPYSGGTSGGTGSYFEGGAGAFNSGPRAGPSTSGRRGASDSGEDEVRPPIAPKREVLVPEMPVYAQRSNSRRKHRFEAFRDFQSENNDGDGPKTLGRIFRPPVDLLHHGSFESAKQTAASRGCWLLVDVQNPTEFPCLVLQRDVWSAELVKDIVRQHFLLWQTYTETEEGERYRQFYPFTDWPHVAVLDPRTGEQLVAWSRLDAQSFPQLVSDFLFHHGSYGEDKPPVVKQASDQAALVDASEESQLAAAIRASITDSLRTKPDESSADLFESDSGSGLETFTDSDAEPALASEVVKTSEYVERSATRKNLNKNFQDNSNSVENSVENGNGCSATSESNIFSRHETEGFQVHSDSDDASEACQSPMVNRSPPLKRARIAGRPPLARSARVQSSSDAANVPTLKDTETTDVTKVTNGAKFEVLVMCRFPCGKRSTVTLSSLDTLETLHVRVASTGLAPEQFELLTTYPRRNLSKLTRSTSLGQANLQAQQVLFVQEL